MVNGPKEPVTLSVTPTMGAMKVKAAIEIATIKGLGGKEETPMRGTKQRSRWHILPWLELLVHNTSEPPAQDPHPRKIGSYQIHLNLSPTIRY